MAAAKKVLICDDEPNIVESVSYVVKSSGYQFLIAENGASALELAKKERPDLMILDVRMPKLSGNQVCEMLKDDAKTRDIHVIVLTAYGQPQDQAFSLACGADDFMVKPFSPRELGAKIRKILGTSMGT
ncbi:MAG: response regulator [Burkholderiales bacterium]|nr:response regulator [Burkholderiales bacterium]